MMTTVKGLTPGATYKVHRAVKAAPWMHYFEQIPGAPVASGNADAAGTLALDLPVRTELVIQGANGRCIYVNNATTVVTSL